MRLHEEMMSQQCGRQAADLNQSVHRSAGESGGHLQSHQRSSLATGSEVKASVASAAWPQTGGGGAAGGEGAAGAAGDAGSELGVASAARAHSYSYGVAATARPGATAAEPSGFCDLSAELSRDLTFELNVEHKLEEQAQTKIQAYEAEVRTQAQFELESYVAEAELRVEMLPNNTYTNAANNWATNLNNNNYYSSKKIASSAPNWRVARASCLRQLAAKLANTRVSLPKGLQERASRS